MSRLRTFLLAGIMTAFMPLVAGAMAPVFTIGGSSQNRTICDNMPVDIGAWLAVTDLDTSETLTWTVVAPPSFGAIAGDGATVPTPGSSLSPTGMTYTPDPGATSDAFTVQVDDGNGGTAVMTILLNINAAPSLTLGTYPAVCRGVTSATLSFSDLQNVGPDTVMFSYTGGIQSWTVPANVTSMKFDLMGASGGNDSYSGAPNPGKGGRIEGSMAVTPGATLNIVVGGRGGDGTITGADGGYNGGGSASFYFFGCGGGGGGATDLRVGGTALSDRRVIAGGGGGNGADNSVSGGVIPYAGGNGGGLTGGNSANNVSGVNAKGGNQAGGGAGATYLGWSAGGNGSSGTGGTGSVQGVSGGGGGGYYGGGGGVWTGGAGGSSYFDPIYAFSITHTQGAHEGDGMATIYYSNPGSYQIIWDATAFGEGFENVVDQPLPESEFTIAVPADAAPGTYHGTITVNNVNCGSNSYPVEITVKPLPDVMNPGDQVLCHGDMTADILLSGSVSGSSYNWVNSNPAIGLDPAGSGHIPSFYPVNATALPVSADITITPVADGCIGESQVFHIVDNPKPTLNSTTAPAAICNNTTFSYIPTSLTPGTTFDWSRAAVAGIANAPASGTGNPNEILFNTTPDPVAVTYDYTLTANGCTNTASVTVVVNPTPALSSTTSPAPLCNGDAFMYTPTSTSSGATLTWTRPTVAGISNAAGSGSGAISETLMNTTTSPKTVTYVINMEIGGCSYNENVAVVVNPPIMLTSATTHTPICDQVLLHYEPSSNISGATLNWSRPDITGIANPAATGAGNIDETLENTTPDPITVTYTYAMSAFGCTVNQDMTIVVNPRPHLSTTLTPAGLCTNTLFAYSPASATMGATFVWARDSVLGISNPATLGSGSVSEILVNTTDTIITVPYLYTTFANACPDSEYVMVDVYPLPHLSNDVSSLAVCDSSLFSFAPTSITGGASFAWTRSHEPGVLNADASGTGNPNEYLNNTTNISIPVTYLYTISANGCANTQSIIVNVRPSAMLVKNTDTVCSSAPVNFKPVSYTTLATFEWTRTGSSGITPADASGSGNIVDTLTQTGSSPVVVEYDMTLTAYGCATPQKFYMTVNPAPPAGVINSAGGNALCNNSTFVNFSAAAGAPDGTTYSWSATNATVYRTGNTGQYAVVSFNTPGNAMVMLTTTYKETGCTATSTYDVTVGDNQAETPEVIYFQGQFICRATNVDSYQWGYDDAGTMKANDFTGETKQNFFVQSPDFTGKFYWVKTVRNNCTQKTYYNVPTGVNDVNTVSADMKVYPNPASNYVNVEVSTFVSGSVRFDLYNLMGQKISSVETRDHSAQISVADLPAGAYVIDCYNDGVKVAAARFIKN